MKRLAATDEDLGERRNGREEECRVIYLGSVPRRTLWFKSERTVVEMLWKIRETGRKVRTRTRESGACSIGEICEDLVYGRCVGSLHILRGAMESVPDGKLIRGDLDVHACHRQSTGL